MGICKRFGRLLIGSLDFAMCICMTAVFFCAVTQAPLDGQQTQQLGKPIRVTVGIVQTDIMVFDRQGHFVPDLKMDQFELRVDGKSQPILFMELVSAGSAHDEAIWASAEGKSGSAMEPPTTKPPSPGRTLFIFVDDWHLSADSVMRSRDALSNLINTSVGPNDKIALFAASGQFGSAQQLTSDKAALLAALEKFNFQSSGVVDPDFPLMNETHAVEIEQNDEDVLRYFVQNMVGHRLDEMVQQRVGPPMEWEKLHGREVEDAKKLVRRRAANLAQISAGVAERSLSALRNLLQMAEAQPGRKIVFLLSDGFVLQPQRSDIGSRIGEVTTRAARAGIVIYTLDARGLVVGLPDGKTKMGMDSTGVASRLSQIVAQQDALNALAADTGGRFLKNTNALDTALISTLTEISRYYLVGWALDPEKLQPGKFSKISATIKGRPDLSVRVRLGSLDLSKLVKEKK